MLAEQLLSDWPAERWQGRRLLVGVSGGADSVALLLALREAAQPGQLTVAHMNHGWRGAESDADQAFVVKLAGSLNLQCICRAPRDRDTQTTNQNDAEECREDAMLAKASAASGTSLEDAAGMEYGEQLRVTQWLTDKTEERARADRYQFFKQAAYEIGASYVVTAHTADDRIETLLHNMLRGSGLAGASSLVMFRPFDESLVLARPLLRKRRAEIEAFLKYRQQSFREDSSNKLSRYKRNFLRNQVMPLITEHYPAAPGSLLSFSELTEELLADWALLADRWLERVTRSLASSSVSMQRAKARWPISQFFLTPQADFCAEPWSIVQAALRQVWSQRGWPLADMSRAHWQAVHELGRRVTGVINLPGNLRGEAGEGFLAIGLAKGQ